MKKIGLFTLTLLLFTAKAADDLSQDILDQIAAEQALAEIIREQRLRDIEQRNIERAIEQSLAAQNQAQAAPAPDVTNEEMAQIAALEEMSLAEEVARIASLRAMRTKILGQQGAFVEGRGIKPPTKPKPHIQPRKKSNNAIASGNDFPAPPAEWLEELDGGDAGSAAAPAPKPKPRPRKKSNDQAGSDGSLLDELKTQLNKMFGEK